MAIDLINIDNLVLGDDFESWFKRTNEVIDALNPLQLYDFYDNGYATGDGVFPTVPGYTTLQDITEATTLGLKITRDVRFLGDMLIEILPEAPLGFNNTTGRLGFVFTGPNAPLLLGTSCSPPDRIERNDLYIVYDFDAGVTKIVEAEDMLPSIIRCDHQFGEIGTPVTITIKGDLVVDGTQTILSTTNVASLDNNIELNALNALLLKDQSNYVSGEDFVNGESVTGQISGTSAQVVSWTPAAIGFPFSELVVTNVAGVFVDGEDVVGGTGGAEITTGISIPPVPTLPAGDDTIADGGGICLLSTDSIDPDGYCIRWQNAGKRWFINEAGWEIDPNFSVFTTTIEPQTNELDIIGSGAPEALSIHLHEVVSASNLNDEHWRLTLQEFNTTGQVGYMIDNYPGDPTNPNPAPFNLDGTLKLQHSTAGDTSPVIDLGIVFDSVTETHDASISGFARNLNADLLDGCHASVVPTLHMIPCADSNGKIDAGWIPEAPSLVKQINQTGHGFTVGQILRIEKDTTTGYVLAQANTEERAEAVGVVGNVTDFDNFELNLRGCMELPLATDWDAITTGKPGADPDGLAPGGVYFLDIIAAGNITRTDPDPGDISKTMLIAIDATKAIVMNYVGGRTDPIGVGAPVIDLTGDVKALGFLGSPVITTIVERTTQIVTALPVEPVLVEDFNGVGHRTFEVTLNANTDLVLTPANSVSWAASAASWQSMVLSGSDEQTNSVTLIITQATGGGHTPDIKILGGSIIWDNSASQPLAAAAVGKTTIYVLINTTSNPTVWYGSRAVFEI